MKTMTFSLIAALALGCASKPVEDLPTEDLDETGGGTGGSDDGGDDGAGDADDDNDGVTVDEGDCNDDDDEIYPGAEETCNGIDDDCDEDIDEGLETADYYQDSDNDGYGNPDEKKEACEEPDGYVDNDEDCNDSERSANPEGTEESFNDIDENCDGLDFGDGEECVEGALELTMDWMEYWTWPLSDSSGTVPTPIPFVEGSYTMSEKYLDVEPQETTATAVDGEPLKVNVTIETEISVQASMIASAPGGFLAQNCILTIEDVPVLYSGEVELDLDGEVVTGEADLNYNILEAADYTARLPDDAAEDDSCNIGIIDDILGYLGYSIDDFIFDDLDDVAKELRTKIEDDLRDWDIPAACTPDYELEETEICLDTCDYAGDGECDDGGPGSDFAICEYGTDCTDCGTRVD